MKYISVTTEKNKFSQLLFNRCTIKTSKNPVEALGSFFELVLKRWCQSSTTSGLTSKKIQDEI